MKYNKTVLLVLVILMGTLSGAAYAQDDDETYTVGVLIYVSTNAFIEEMAELGYVEGENTTYITVAYSESTDEEILAARIQEILDAEADVLVVNTDSDALGIQALAGNDIPIVFARSDDPVSTGAVESLVNPGGNITGVVSNNPNERRLQILTEVNPQTQKVYYLYSTLTGEAETVLQRVQELAEELEIELVPAPITDLDSSLELLENTPEDTDWFFLTPYVPYDTEFRETLLAISESRQIGVAGFSDSPSRGYLIGYGANLDDTSRQAATIVDLVLRGARPEDLPVQTAENFLTVDLATAESIGWDIPVSVLRQADTIIRADYWEARDAEQEAQATQEAQEAQEEAEEASGD
jgi:putative tryptophan/tyrosine transport system substrate-binding protein